MNRLQRVWAGFPLLISDKIVTGKGRSAAERASGWYNLHPKSAPR